MRVRDDVRAAVSGLAEYTRDWVLSEKKDFKERTLSESHEWVTF